VLAYLLLGIAQLVGLLMIPFGGPGVWVQLAALGVFGWWTEFGIIGTAPLLVLLLVALTAELIEPPLAGGRIDRPVRRRLGGAGLIGSIVGASVGFPLPLLGSLFGAFVGAIVGTSFGVLGAKTPGSGCATIGAQVLAMATRTAAGVVVAVFTLVSLMS
jgi:uncharacterized protein